MILYSYWVWGGFGLVVVIVPPALASRSSSSSSSSGVVLVVGEHGTRNHIYIYSAFILKQETVRCGRNRIL